MMMKYIVKVLLLFAFFVVLGACMDKVENTSPSGIIHMTTVYTPSLVEILIDFIGICGISIIDFYLNMAGKYFGVAYVGVLSVILWLRGPFCRLFFVFLFAFMSRLALELDPPIDPTDFALSFSEFTKIPKSTAKYSKNTL